MTDLKNFYFLFRVNFTFLKIFLIRFDRSTYPIYRFYRYNNLDLKQEVRFLLEQFIQVKMYKL